MTETPTIWVKETGGWWTERDRKTLSQTGRLFRLSKGQRVRVAVASFLQRLGFQKAAIRLISRMTLEFFEVEELPVAPPESAHGPN